MRRYWLDMLLQAVSGLRDNARRSLLSVLGIAVGIAAVIVIESLGKGARLYVMSELHSFGISTVWVFRNYQEKDPRRAVRPGTGIDNRDYESLQGQAFPAIRRISPIISTRTYRGFGEHYRKLLVRNGNRYSNARLEGVAESFVAINGDTLAAGRNFSVDEVRRGHAMALLTEQAAADLFGTLRLPLGRLFRIKDRQFQVAGILRSKQRALLTRAGVTDDNNRILIPYTAYQNLLGMREISRLQIEARTPQESERALQQVVKVLERRHNGQYAYAGESMWSHALTAERILRAVTIVGVVSALVSLFVGGLGITNIMYTSVLERTREIGLRKAIGARARDIGRQFLLEAALISACGGMAGLGLGYAISVWFTRASGFPLAPSVWAIAGAMGAALLVGLASGFLPARRAARLVPVEALRYE